MGLNVEFSYEDGFVELWSNIQKTYGTEIFNMDGVGEQLDVAKFSKKFFSNSTTVADVSIDGNANVTDNGVVAYTTELSKPEERLNSYAQLWKYASKMFDFTTANEMVTSNIIGDIYVNDFHGLGSGKPYCFNYSTYDINVNGLSTVDKIKSVAPKYLYSFKSQVEQFVTIASNSTLGATGLADLLVVMSFYVDKALATKSDAHFHFATKKDVWIYVRESIASMIYTLNQPMRGNQSPFTNISLYDDKFLESISKDYLNPETGEKVNMNTVKKIQRLFIDCMNDELRRTPVTFPVTTACFSIDRYRNIRNVKFLREIAEKNLEFGFMNLYLGDSSTISSCCRLRSELVNDYFNSLGAGSSKIGSLGVGTVNLPRLAYKANSDENLFFMNLRHLVELIFRINYVKRTIVEERIRDGKHPLYSMGYIDINKQYLTCGVNGFNECIEIMGYDPLSDEGVNFGIKLINTINEVNNQLGAEYHVPVNVEQIPAENTSIKLADKDRLMGYNKGEYEIYSNQFIPLVTKADMLDRIKLQGVYDKHFSGGSILHINVEERITDPEYIVELVKTCAKMGVVYLAINYNLQRCEKGHMGVGKETICTICGKPIVDNFTRVVGFLTNVKNWHKTRRRLDYPNRVFYKSGELDYYKIDEESKKEYAKKGA
jgi:ribonucleoside-triphosphate reductase